MSRIELQGRTFGKLTVLDLSEQRECSGARLWRCRCDCGNITYASANKLLTGRKKSCGCGARVKPSAPKPEYPPKTDCVCHWEDMDGGCIALTEKLCVTRGSCKFYKSKFSVQA